VNATPARTARLLPWAGACLAVAVACAVHAARLPHYQAAWFAYAPLDQSDGLPDIPVNPEVEHYGIAAVAACGLGLLLLGAYLTGRFQRRSIP
jgi:hypothetical protein